jgi:hypothetical protein
MARLAIKGGEKVRSKDFTAWPVFTKEEVDAATNVVESGNWWRYSYGQGIDYQE